jgi:hypothetical protein
MELELENTIIGIASKNILKIHKKIRIWKLDNRNISHLTPKVDYVSPKHSKTTPMESEKGPCKKNIFF